MFGFDVKEDDFYSVKFTESLRLRNKSDNKLNDRRYYVGLLPEYKSLGVLDLVDFKSELFTYYTPEYYEVMKFLSQNVDKILNIDSYGLTREFTGSINLPNIKLGIKDKVLSLEYKDSKYTIWGSCKDDNETAYSIWCINDKIIGVALSDHKYKINAFHEGVDIDYFHSGGIDILLPDYGFIRLEKNCIDVGIETFDSITEAYKLSNLEKSFGKTLDTVKFFKDMDKQGFFDSQLLEFYFIKCVELNKSEIVDGLMANFPTICTEKKKGDIVRNIFLGGVK